MFYFIWQSGDISQIVVNEGVGTVIIFLQLYLVISHMLFMAQVIGSSVVPW